MHNSGASRREAANVRLDLSSLRANGAALCADPLARNDGLKLRVIWLFEN